MSEPRTYGRRRSLPARPAEESNSRKGRGEAAPARRDAAPREAISGRVVATGAGQTAMAGWDDVDKIASAASGDFYLKVGESRTVIKILSDGPFDVYASHWIDEIEDGSKSVRCWANSDCPLCALGDKAKRFSACFDVVSLEDPDSPSMKVWEAGIKIARQLKDIATDSKRGPLDRPDLYFTIRKETKKKSVEYTLERVKERDLEEEYNVPPLTDEELAAFVSQRHEYGTQVKEPLDQEAMEDVVSLLMEDA
ncbi:hypothetical protein [Streptomyces sp. MMBL 11-1]|uniref:hypothetical protein n=1 Tax=Streptomyces sp. MMBL 11-1 TaxID=3026420 RepID=UPI00236109D6|nr:hypothetical protein [Streptomyces sp. MMBL 11-1]